jgi:hypothetical protein
MTPTRRRLLAAVGALAGTAGCLGGDGVRYPEVDDAASSGGPGTDAPATPGEQPVRAETQAGTGTADDAADRATLRPALAGRAARIFDEVRWFARLYDGAVERLFETTRRAARTVEAVRDDMDPGLDDAGLAEIRAVRADTRATVERWLGAHFLVDEQIRDNVDYHLSVVEKFRRRGDHDRVAEELTRLARFYRGVGSSRYVEDAMSRHPIQNRLFDWLQGDAPRDVAFAIRSPTERLSAFVYGGPKRQGLGDPVAGDRRRRVESAFGPLAVDTATATLYVLAYAFDDPDDGDDGDDGDDELPPVPGDLLSRPSQPVFCQRFADADAAAAALSGLLDGPATAEGTYRFGRDEWRRVYWRVAGDVTYGFVLRAGAFVFATAPSQVAWEERVDWRRPLEGTFLYRP